MILQFLDQLVAWLILAVLHQHDGSLYDLATNRVRHCGDGSFQNCWVLQQSAFYFEWTNAVAAGFDNVVASAFEEDIAIFILPSHIASVVEATSHHFGGLFWVFIVAHSDAGRNAILNGDADFANFTPFTFMAIFCHDHGV